MNPSDYDLEREYGEKAVLKFRDRMGKHVVELACGSRDEVEVFREGEFTYALSWNDGLWYVGIEKFRGATLEADLFLQNSEDVEGCLGKKGLELAPITMVKRLAEYLY